MDKIDGATFRLIAELTGIKLSSNSSSKGSLSDWFTDRLDVKIKDLTVDDLGIACRQILFLEYIVPECLHRLHKDPLTGSKYDGELLVALKKVPSNYWTVHPYQAKELQSIIKSVPYTIDDELRRDILELVILTGSSER